MTSYGLRTGAMELGSAGPAHLVRAVRLALVLAAVALAFREMLMNAIEHGANFNATQHVSISYLRAKHMVLCRVKDPGEGFSLQEARHAAIMNPPSDPIRHTALREKEGLRPGGFGILLTKHIIDELIYSETGNEVVLIKYLSPEQHETG